MHCPLSNLESPWLGVNMGKQGGSVEQEEPQVSPDLNVSLLTYNILVESRSWRDRNLKFGPNCDLEVDDLGKK